MANCSTFLQVLFRCLFVLAIFFVCLPHSSDGNEELENTLRCAMAGNFDWNCKLSGPEMQPHMIELLKRAPSQFRNVLKKPKADFKATLVGKIPLSLVYLLPAEVWSRVEPNVASELVKSHKWNEAIGRSVTRGYSTASLMDKNTFLAMIDFDNLDSSVVSVIASQITSNWTMDAETLVSVTSPSFYVALPGGYVLGMERSLHIEMLNQIVNWNRFGLSKEKWFELPAITKRVWAIVSRNYSWEGSDKKPTTPLLAGATPSELQHEGKLFSEYELMQLPLKNRLQVRALLPVVRTEEILTKFDLTLLKNWFLLLSPEQITRFREDLDFMNVVKEKHIEWSSHPLTQRPFGFPSIPTLRQIIEITTLVYNERQSLPLDPRQWGNEIIIFGPLAYLIGAPRLGHLNEDHKPLVLHTLKEIDSQHFSKRMARHLMFKSQDILKVNGLLKGVTTGHLYRFGGSHPESEMDNWREIVRNIPTDDYSARLALVFRKIRENLGVFNNLEAILRNQNCGHFFLLLTSEETATLYSSLAHHWSRIVSENLADKIPQLPDLVLEKLLSSPRKSKFELSQSAHLESKALAGLTCNRLLSLDVSNVPEIIATMRRARKRAGKTDMSKRLQRCARIALDKFLIERASSTFASRKAVLNSTVSAINPVDIENFGGFVLATFSPDEIVKNPHAKMIMKKIGSLSAYELISAVPCYKYLRSMAETALEIFNVERSITVSHLLDLGSLVDYLPPKTILTIDPAQWRIIAEAAALDGSSQPICADGESRSGWESIIRAAFGRPEEWKADTLAAIGGYMPALRESILQSVSLDEVTAAGDTMPLTSGKPYLEGVELIGYDHPRSFWKACRDLLPKEEREEYETSVKNAARFQLQGAQLLANKVKSSDALRQLQAQYHPAFKSVTTTETPQDLSKQSSTEKAATTTTTTTTTSTTSSTSFNLGLWEKMWTKSDPAEKDESTDEPLKKETLEVSDDLVYFLDAFDRSLDSGEEYNKDESTEAATETVSDSDVGTIVSIDSIRQESMDNFNSMKSQVVVDTDNETDNKTDDFVDPAVDLKLKLKDVSDSPAVASSSTPLPETNGTVLSLKGLPKISAEVSKDEGNVLRTEPPTDGNEETLIITPSNGNGLSKDLRFTTAKMVNPSSSTPTLELSSKPYTSTPPSTLNKGLVRRRRDVDVQSFKMTLTCDGLRTIGPAASLALSSADVDMPYEEFEECVEFLGSLELPKKVAKAFWNKLNKENYWETIGDVGCLVAGMTTTDIYAFDLDTSNEHFLDTISVISKYADKDVVKTMLSKLQIQLEADITNHGKVALAEEIVLALGQDVCYLPERIQSHLVNTPNVLLRSLYGMNRDGFFEHTPCQPKCLRSLLKAVVNQNKSEEWTAEDSRNAGILVAGFSEEELKKMSSLPTSNPLGEISAAAARCLTENQLKATMGESVVWGSSLAAGALSEGQLQTLSAEQRSAIDNAIFGRPGVSPAEEVVITSSSGASTLKLKLLASSAVIVLTCYRFLLA